MASICVDYLGEMRRLPEVGNPNEPAHREAVDQEPLQRCGLPSASLHRGQPIRPSLDVALTELSTSGRRSADVRHESDRVTGDFSVIGARTIRVAARPSLDLSLHVAASTQKEFYSWPRERKARRRQTGYRRAPLVSVDERRLYSSLRIRGSKVDRSRAST